MHIFKGWEKHLTHYLVNQREKKRKSNNYDIDIYVYMNTDAQTSQFLDAKTLATSKTSCISQSPWETWMGVLMTTTVTFQGALLVPTSLTKGFCCLRASRAAVCCIHLLILPISILTLRPCLQKPSDHALPSKPVNRDVFKHSLCSLSFSSTLK